MFSGGNPAQGMEAVVVDFGSFQTRIGFAGEDTPRCVVSSEVGQTIDGRRKLVDSIPKTTRRSDDFTSIERLMMMHSDENELVVQDWSLIEHVLDHAYERLSIPTSSEHPVLLTEPNFPSQRRSRERWTELLFERNDVPALFVAKTAVLGCFANGRSSGMIVDLGASHSSVIPVHEGFVLSKPMKSLTSAGGDALDAVFLELLEKQQSQQHNNPQHNPQQPQSKAPKFQSTTRRHVMQHLKETVCRVNDVAFSMNDNLAIPTVSYALPDGQTLEIGPERFEVPERLFRHDAAPMHHGPPSVPQTVLQVTNQCDMDLRRDFFQNIVLTGGTSCFDNLPQRLERELSTLVPATFKVKVIASHRTERKNAAWLGGSILGSLGSFHDMWISKSEYAEHGASIVHRKCP